jgi:hypothetical protein
MIAREAVADADEAHAGGRVSDVVHPAVSAQDACRMALVEALTDEPGTRQALEAALEASF